MCQTYIVNKNKKRYNKDEWNTEYIKYLEYLYKENSPKHYSIYNDPDSDYNRHSEFYEDLEIFLNSRENAMNKENKLKEMWKYKFEKNSDLGIKVMDENENWLFTIFSDQFGFSAPTPEYKKDNPKNHPYDVYAKISNDNDNTLKEALKLISNCVYYSRTIGGSFLWPIDGGKGYNMKRGGTSCYRENYYIQDRVDLTLLEIKKYYDHKLNLDINVSNDIINNYLTDNMKKWLDHFKDFKTYVEFFYFDDFVYTENEECFPIPLLGNLKDLDGRKWKKLMPGIKYNDENYKKELEEVFNTLRTKIIARSEQIIEHDLKEKDKNEIK